VARIRGGAYLGTVPVTQSGTWDEVGINDSGNSITVDAPQGTPVFVRLSDGTNPIATLPVSLASVPSHAVTNAGTFAVQVDGAALTALQLIDNAVSGAGFNITQFNGEAIDVGAGTEAAAIRVTLPTDGTGVVKLGAGTAGIGKLTANSGVDIGDVDVTSVPRSLSGPGQPGTAVDSYTSDDDNLAANTADQSVVAAPGANKQIWVYGLIGTVNVAGSISIQDEDNVAHSGVMPVGVTGGFVMNPSGNFSMPWIKVATNKALEIDTVTCEFDGIITYAIVSV